MSKSSGLQIGDYARNIESGWVGRIDGFEDDQNGDLMASMRGVDLVLTHVLGVPVERAINDDDRQWHAPADLERVPVTRKDQS